VAGVIILLLALSAGIFSQQTGSARRPAGNPGEASASASKTSSTSRVTGAVVKSDVSEALSVIQDNYIDGKKLDYNSIFKS
jgi:hypothetical protein